MSSQDEVDGIIADWECVRPDLDFRPLSVFSRLSRIAKHFGRARARAFERSGLESWEFDVLAVLRRSGPPFRASAKVLIQSTMVSSGTMTNRIDRLLQRGLVERLTDPDDGRAVIVSMTPAGRMRVDSAITRLVDAEDVMLRGLSGVERDRTSTLLRKLAKSVNDYGSLPEHGGPDDKQSTPEQNSTDEKN
ncbi:MAG: MarR family winged helix-turn-helix transcriptional regulator [Canibacter sp.]